MSELTKRQTEVLKIIEKETKRLGAEPSLTSIAEKLEININGVVGHIKALEKKGYLTRHQSSFELTQEEKIPIVADIAAGLPQEAPDQSDQYLAMPPQYFGSGKIVAVRVRGDSMIGDGIFDGDLVMIQLQKTHVHKNEILAVRVGLDEITLKRLQFYKSEGKQMCNLVPSNPDFKVKKVPAEHVSIVGKMVGLVRKV